MSSIQERKLNKIIHSWSVEGFDTPDNEKQVLIDVIEGKRDYKDVLEEYIKEIGEYARV
jgi:hypothetical protein